MPATDRCRGWATQIPVFVGRSSIYRLSLILCPPRATSGLSCCQPVLSCLQDKPHPARKSFVAILPRPLKMPHMNCRDKILSPESLPAWRERARRSGRTVAVTNGCFDLLHAGHVTYLESAKQHADLLLVAVNADATVRHLKGPSRPLNSQDDRALVLAALQSVDAVIIFHESDATRLLETVRPDVYVKGGDYTLDTINQPERRLVERLGGKVIIMPGVPGKSTTALVGKLAP